MIIGHTAAAIPDTLPDCIGEHVAAHAYQDMKCEFCSFSSQWHVS